MAITHDPDICFDPDNKPTIAAGDVENGALAEATLLVQADAWQVQLLYGGPANMSIFIDDVLETYRVVQFCRPAFVDRVRFGVIATGSGDVTIKTSAGDPSADYEIAIPVQNALESATTDAALAGASAYWQPIGNLQPFDDTTAPLISGFQIKRGSDVRVFGIVLKLYRSLSGL